MTEKIKKTPYGVLCLLRAAALIVIFLLKGLFFALSDGVYRKSGRISRQVYSADDFTQNSIVYKDGAFVATDNDPQLVMEYDGRIDKIVFYMERTVYPGEMAAYYTQKEGEPFSERKRAWIKPTDEKNVYRVDLGMKEIKRIRLDPTMYAGNRMTFGDFSFNPPVGFAGRFAPSYGDFFNLLVYSCLIRRLAKTLADLPDALLYIKSKIKKKDK